MRKLENKVYLVPTEVDEIVVRRFLEVNGIKPERLTEELVRKKIN